MPYIATAGELKTKPTQHSVKELRSIGIQPDVLLVRCDRPIPDSDRRKLALFCNVRESAVIPALDVASIYDVPVAYHDEGLDREVLAAFGEEHAPAPDLERWREITRIMRHPEGEVTIAVVGKYTGLKDAYKSLIEALQHGGIANKVQVNLDWIESEIFEKEDPAPYLERVNGILVPGGFGERGTEGKINAVTFARTRKVPYLRHLLRHADGGDRGGAQPRRHRRARARREFGPADEPVVGLMTEWLKGNELETRLAQGDLGGTMRLGAYPAILRQGQPHRRDLRRHRDLRAPPPPLRGEHRLPRAARGGRPVASPACRPTTCCPRRSSSPTIPGSSACSSIRS